MKTGDLALNFNLADQNNNFHSLSDYRGKWVLLYFYPKDNTPGCTREACSFRDALGSFNKLSIQVLGISADTTASHKKFAEKFKLSFPLLSDPEKKVIKDYDVLAKKKFLGKETLGIKRMSFLIDPNGKIVKIYQNIRVADHAEEILRDQAELA